MNELVSGAAPNNNYLNIWFNNILYTMFVQLFWTPVIFDISNKFKESSELIRKTKKKTKNNSDCGDHHFHLSGLHYDSLWEWVDTINIGAIFKSRSLIYSLLPNHGVIIKLYSLTMYTVSKHITYWLYIIINARRWWLSPPYGKLEPTIMGSY